MRIGLVQISSAFDEAPEARRDRVAKMLREAPQCDLYVLPELWAPGYFAFNQYLERAEDLATGPTTTALAAIARERRAFIHIGSVLEKAGEGRVRNTAAVLGRDGEAVLSYSKIHVFGYQSREADLVEAGSRIDVAHTELGTISTTACYDLRFPGLWQRLSELGTEVAVIPAAWPRARIDHWRVLSTARAIEHQMLVIATNATGYQGEVALGGHSRVVDPWGEVLLELDEREQIGVVDVDDDVVTRTRREFPVLDDRLTSY